VNNRIFQPYLAGQDPAAHGFALLRDVKGVPPAGGGNEQTGSEMKGPDREVELREWKDGEWKDGSKHRHVARRTDG
jgi:hypothetical protein